MSESVLKYRTFAEEIGEAVPISNGNISGMVYGKPIDELVELNLSSFWSGRRIDRINSVSPDGIREIRNLMENGDIVSAEKKSAELMQGESPNMRTYVPFLELHIGCITDGKARNYARCLDLSTSVASVAFDVGEKRFQRDYICTGDEGMVIGFSCNAEDSISFDVWLDGKEEFSLSGRAEGEHTVIYKGSSDGIDFVAGIAVKADGGEVKISGNRISVRNADSVMLICNAETDAETQNVNDAYEIVSDHIKDALNMEFAEIEKNYISWYQSLYNKVELYLEDDSKENLDILATDERILRLQGDKLNNKECTRLINDNKLIELYFNFGRYIMITFGTGTYPMIWRGSDDSQNRYLLAGNLQMCYWAADVCGITDCLNPLFDFIERLTDNGMKAAEKMYGIDESSVCHFSADMWGDSVPQGNSPDSFWCMGLAWLAVHFFEHYEYIMDRDFIEGKYYTMKKIANFFVNYLTEDENGRLIVSPSVSPTSAYISENGEKLHFCKGSAVDSQILRVFLNDTIKACYTAGYDDEFGKILEPLVERLPEIEIGKYGQIKEWYGEYGEAESSEKLLYNLFALYPSDLITPVRTPKLANAARTTLVRRLIHGGLDKGFGCAWTADMWARLYDGDMVYENLKNLLTRSTAPNLVNTYPDFSIDANMGAVTAIAESLLQCTNGEIVLLPALPQEWHTGYVRGLRAKGGFEVSMEWENGRLKGAEIISHAGEECRIRFVANIPVSIISEDENVSPSIDKSGAVVFGTTKETIYTIRC